MEVLCPELNHDLVITNNHLVVFHGLKHVNLNFGKQEGIPHTGLYDKRLNQD